MRRTFGVLAVPKNFIVNLNYFHFLEICASKVVSMKNF